jgi:hypothetical protein
MAQLSGILPHRGLSFLASLSSGVSWVGAFHHSGFLILVPSLRWERSFRHQNPPTRHTNQNEPTTAHRKGTGSPSTAEDTRDTRLRCRRCSTNARRCKTTDRPCAETSRIMDSEYAGRRCRHSCREQDPGRLRLRAGTCPDIMNRASPKHCSPIHKVVVAFPGV